ncbi:GNAT family N-acetyltransferase [Gracilibacillus alcaliphilus]|uniref:GNAT family N-acetyltransferase n=1 Tax=Gracilibacillus alcaliphilus TaxID=1401441 RepID=UPI00195EDDEE|nr:GNAT family N-acetyltransferase [Gracilibacillus alcaliphilus]MBM7677168.1 putative acetyltransferase [Gracilibacillus alcaliphilus]
MAGEILVRSVEENEKSVLRQLMELYAYDFSEFNGEDVNQYGFYGYRFLDHYWTESGRFPFFILVDNTLAGFILVSDHCYVLNEANSHSIAEFFIMRKYRKARIGSKAASLIFKRFTGYWEVLVHPENHAANQFWREVIGEFTAENYRATEVTKDGWTGTGYLFSTKQCGKD